MLLSSTLLCFLSFSLGLASPVAGPQVLGQPTRSVIIAPPDVTEAPPAPSIVTPSPTVVAPGTPTAKPPKKCKKPSKRKAWQALSKKEKKAYIDAELCLMKNPTKTNLEAAITRFDDLIKPHQLQGFKVHNTGYFLPFHRLLMQAHETLLRTECGYKGYQPYWAEELDIGQIEKSEVLDPVTGFGGGVLNKTVCVPDGPFKDYVLHTGPGFENTEHCIQRRLTNHVTYGARQEYIDHCYKFEKFEDAWQCLESSGPHNGYHGGVGGEMNNPISSPGDPVFYLHHSWLDKVWWDWQKQKPERLTDISGRKEMIFGGNGTFPPLPGGLPFPGNGTGGFPFPVPGNGTGAPGVPNFDDFVDLIDFSGPPDWKPTPGPPVDDPVKLDDVINMYGVIANQTVREVMDIKGGVLCYEYVDYKDAVKPKWI